MRTLVATGQAPHYTELATELGVPMERSNQLVVGVMSSGLPGWVDPGTNYIASFPPFNNQPTQYRVSVDGEQRWSAQ